MKPPYYTIEQLLEKIDEPNGSACRRLLADNRKLFQATRPDGRDDGAGVLDKQGRPID